MTEVVNGENLRDKQMKAAQTQRGANGVPVNKNPVPPKAENPSPAAPPSPPWNSGNPPPKSPQAPPGITRTEPKPSIVTPPPVHLNDFKNIQSKGKIDGKSGEDEEVEDMEKVSPLKKIRDRFIGIFRKGREEDDESKYLIKIAKKEVMADERVNPEWEFIRALDLGDTHVKVDVYLDKETSEYIYNPVEPKMAPRQTEVYEFIKEILGNALRYDKNAMEDPEEKKRFLDRETKNIIRDYNAVIGDVNDDFMDPINYYLRREYIGYGRIQSIMLDIGVEDVSCDGTDIPVFVYHRDYGSIKTTIKFDTDEELEGFVVSLAQRAGKNISVAEPILDATLPEGHRLNATFGREVTTRGSSFTIRKFKEDPLTIVDLVKFNTLSDEMAAHFWLGVQYAESMIFAGGTASGKTATMNAISIFIPSSAKIISIEDTREVNLPHQNWIAGITRGGADSDKQGNIDMYQLLRAALRQRPEYVLVGEVRGKETMTMFQAMATGHVTYSTMHADSVKSIVYRLENPPISIPRVLIQALNLVAIHNQLRVKDMRVRRITELVEIVGIEPTSLEIITNKVYKWEAAGDVFVFGGHSNLYEKIMDMEDMTRDEVVNELSRRAEVISWMVKNDIRQFKDVNKVVAEFYEEPDKVMRIIRDNMKIDISKGLHIFDEEPVDGLPESTQEALPDINASSASAMGKGGDASVKGGA
ncbi:MAG: type II/IV secretion system ATPase subunit [Thermoplasmatota archaeon]